MRFLSVLVLALALSGCNALPEIRLFQKKVPENIAEKPPAQVEAERAAAAYIVKRTTPPVPDPEVAVVDVHSAAQPLSASLGEPKKEVTAAPDNRDWVIAQLRQGILEEQKKTEQWKVFAKQYAGTKLEGTGFNITSWLGGFGFIAFIAALIFVPGLFTFVLFIIKRLRGTIRSMAQGIEEFQAAEPKAAKELKEYLADTMDRTHKVVVKQEKAHLDEKRILESAVEAAGVELPSTDV